MNVNFGGPSLIELAGRGFKSTVMAGPRAVRGILAASREIGLFRNVGRNLFGSIGGAMKAGIEAKMAARLAAADYASMKEFFPAMDKYLGPHISDYERKELIKHRAWSFITRETDVVPQFGSDVPFKTFKGVPGGTPLDEGMRSRFVDEVINDVLEPVRAEKRLVYTDKEMKIMGDLVRNKYGDKATEEVVGGVSNLMRGTALEANHPLRKMLPTGLQTDDEIAHYANTQWYSQFGHEAIETERRHRKGGLWRAGITAGTIGSIGFGTAMSISWEHVGMARRRYDEERREISGPDPYVPFPGTTSKPPDLGADGDIVFAMHNLHGSGRNH